MSNGTPISFAYSITTDFLTYQNGLTTFAACDQVVVTLIFRNHLFALKEDQKSGDLSTLYRSFNTCHTNILVASTFFANSSARFI